MNRILPAALLSSGAWSGILLLAVVQGVTEFLPVSSSGHLALGQALLGIGGGSILDDVALHLGTLVAVAAYYREDLRKLLQGAFARGQAGGEARRYALLLIAANLPAGIVGIGLRSRIERSFESIPLVLLCLFLTGAVLLGTRWLRRGEQPIDLRAALLMGLAQAVAILPGCSRSGWTIAMGLALGLRPSEAARFSFLMSMPAILGATLLELRDAGEASFAAGPLLAGMAVSAAVGLLCLAWLVRLVRGMALHRFTPYLWTVAAVGALALALRS